MSVTIDLIDSSTATKRNLLFSFDILTKSARWSNIWRPAGCPEISAV